MELSTSRRIEGSNGSNAVPTNGASMAPETFADIDLDPFVSYLSDLDPNTPAPNSSGERRDEDSRWTGFWGGPQTGYQRVSVANEDVKKPGE